ncbi:cytochrome P450 2J4-like [Paramacrobiotus metropolitanus]|uniref:cytochrome P450 2J4-like n=1 Tax=Paramacrobiotus metropolitanus TaxID=2943436 RepID=UPI0024462B9A|nr:cytochrome P450 2J4-like [Paramacrobiotus metropolitanus]
MLLALLGTLFSGALLYSLYYIAAWYLREWRYRWPPGPRCLPLIGLPLMPSDLKSFHRVHYDFAKKYGSIVRTMIGPIVTVQLNDPKVIKEAFSRDVFVPRPTSWYFYFDERARINDGATGVIFSKGQTWKDHRGFILQKLRDFGVGKFKMEEKIVEETATLIKLLEAANGQPIDTRAPLSSTVANVIGSVLMGTRYAPDDPVFVDVMRWTCEIIQFTPKKVFLALFPFLRHVPPFSATYAEVLGTLRGFKAFFRKPIQEHLDNWQPDRNADFIDTYIAAVKEQQPATFNMNELQLTLDDLFEAGFETTTTTLRWAFLLMAAHPDIQAKVHAELDKNIPLGTYVKLSDKEQLPYTEATITEVHRFASIFPLGAYHAAEEDATIQGYDIPKGTWLQANIYFVHHNTDWWDAPEQFNPDRFLTGKNQVQASDNVIPFGLGKRRCLGEALARAELFIIFTAVMQRFTVHLPDSVQTADLTPTMGVLTDTQPHKLCFVSRNNPIY